MTNDQALQIINRAEEIKARIEGGTLYGNRIDTENVNHVILAAYFLGQQDCGESKTSILKTVV